jgi:hypothetical protein
MPSATYQLFREAILSAKQITCDYQGYHRELCPIILGTRMEKGSCLPIRRSESRVDSMRRLA